MTTLAVLAAVVLAYALVSRRLRGSVVSIPMFFVAAGILAGPDVLDLIQLEATDGTVFHVAEIALALVVFSEAARVDLEALRGDASLPGRLLGLGVPAMVALGMVAGAALLTELEFWEAAMVAAVLVPSDATLALPAVTSPRVPPRIRQALQVQSGLSDGMAVPFLALFVAIAVHETVPDARDWVGFAVEQIGLGTVIGLLVGGVGAGLARYATDHGWTTGRFQQLAAMSLAILAFVLADEAGGNGFIAAFAGGLVAGRIGRASGDAPERVFDFAAGQGQLLSLAVFLIFGVVAIDFLGDADWRIALYAAVSLTLVRMAAVALATAGLGFRRSTVAFMGWFGPRGLASIILALVVAHQAPELPALGTIVAAVTLTVLASVVLHGISAPLLVRAYGREVERLPPDAPELAG